MTAAVRIFFHAGVATAAVAAGTRFTTDSVSMLKQPYEGRSRVDAGTGAAVSCAAAPRGTTLAYIQVQEGKAVHFEVNPPNRTTAADADSPILHGSTQILFGEGWTISLLEHTLA